jgi:hypothetical protein
VRQKMFLYVLPVGTEEIHKNINQEQVSRRHRYSNPLGGMKFILNK